MHAAAIGNRKAINIYGISIFYNLIFVTIDTQTEYIIKVVHIIDDKSKVTFSIPSKTQKEDTSNSPADLFYTYISCKVIGLSNNTVMFWPRQDMQRQNDLLNHKFTSRTGKEAIDFQFTTYISSTANRQIIDMTFREMIIMAIFY